MLERPCSKEQERQALAARSTGGVCSICQSTNAWTAAGAVLERPRSEEQEREERDMLRGAWEVASVLEFLEVFHVQLGLSRRCRAADLEAALVLSPGGPGVLADLHLVRPEFQLEECGIGYANDRIGHDKYHNQATCACMTFTRINMTVVWCFLWRHLPCWLGLCHAVHLLTCPEGFSQPARGQGLLRGISTRSELTEQNWATRLGDRLRVVWQAGALPGRPPFAPPRGQEALEYARLPTMQRQAPAPLTFLCTCLKSTPQQHAPA